MVILLLVILVLALKINVYYQRTRRSVIIYKVVISTFEVVSTYQLGHCV